MTHGTPELLAPAGGIAQLKAAVQSGADAVYMGGYAFNARRSAKNFTADEMREMIRYCHLYGVKVHVAVNTLIHDRELPELLEYVYMLNEMGADALILQDIGAAKMIKTALPEMELHASTQMTVTSIEGVQYLEQFGFDRVVLARELSKNEIEAICRSAHAEIEVFVHGAICECYSGQCLMSSVLGGRSGNRGRCAQPCRLRYTLTGDRPLSGYLLSPKDMALINELSELKRIGVASLKIEGRLKRPEYVSAVTGIYRKYLDFPGQVTKQDMTELKNAFSRSGFTDGYFKNRLGAAMMSVADPSHAENTFTAEARARAAENADFRKVPVNISAYITIGEPVQVTVYDNDGNCASASGTIPAENAVNRPLSRERITEQLGKLGGTPFAADSVLAEISDNVTVPIKELNTVRRAAIAELTEFRTAVLQRRTQPFTFPELQHRDMTPVLTASVRNESQAKAIINAGIQTLYVPASFADSLAAQYPGLHIIADTGAIFHAVKTDCESVRVASNAAAYYYRKKKRNGSFRLNLYNALSAEHYRDFESVTLSPELNIKEIKTLLNRTKANAGVIGYGRIPLMLMKNCPLKAAGKCQHQNQRYRLRDRKNEEFPILCGEHCICELVNSKPLFMADRLDELTSLPLHSIELLFTIETAEECAAIAQTYHKALNGQHPQNPFGENAFTRGHFFRGVD